MNRTVAELARERDFDRFSNHFLAVKKQVDAVSFSYVSFAGTTLYWPFVSHNATIVAQ